MTEDIIEGTPARHWQKLSDGRIQCDVCPRECRLQEGQRGLCFVRARTNDEIVLTTYGRSSGFCIDPIEKKPLNHFLPGTPVLSFGTAGCNLTCKFCQNHDISKSRKMDKLQAQASPERIAEAAKQNNCRSVAYTYNDPIIFLEYADDIASACHELGLKNVAVTAGYIKEGAREDFFEKMDAVNLDIKGFTEDFYKKLCTAQLGNVLETAEYLAQKADTWLEVTTLLIPGENDSEGELHELCEWFVSHLGVHVPLHFTAFHPDFRMLDKSRTPPETLLRAYRIARSKGILYAYTGNIHHEPTNSTYCSGCGDKLIGRDWHLLRRWNISDGACRNCGVSIAGVFENSHGTWGRKRQRVILDSPAAALESQEDWRGSINNFDNISLKF